jgi:D-ribose pyranose/furanose isomerase RbsD
VKIDLAMNNFLKSEIEYLVIQLKEMEVENIQIKYNVQTQENKVERITKEVWKIEYDVLEAQKKIDEIQIDVKWVSNA